MSRRNFRQVSFGGPLTPAMKWIMINTAMVWLAQLAMVYFGPYARFFDWFALNTDYVLEGRVWQLFTYMFLHDVKSPFHILLNLIILYMFGGQMELRWGSRNFVFFYFLCGLAGAVAVIFWDLAVRPTIGAALGGDPNPHPTVGASAAILGILASYCVTWPERAIYLLGVVPLKGKHLLWITIGIDFLFFLVPTSDVSFQAHMGGLAMGVLLTTGYWHPRKLKQRYRRWRTARRVRGKGSNDDKTIRGPWLH